MIIISQDKTMILNFKNIEAIGIGNPLEDKDGKFKILCNTTSDNQYPMAEYETEERAKEVLQQIVRKYAQYFEDRERKPIIIPKVYEMPKE